MKERDLLECEVYKKVISDKNIYLSIYSLESYILNKELLDTKDRKELEELKDIYNVENMQKYIKRVRAEITELILNDKYFICSKVFFKPKKFENGELKFRPLHTANLIQQIAIRSMLNIFIYDRKTYDTNKLILSNLSNLLPCNFYGNIISEKAENLYKPWKRQYGEYIEMANELFSNYYENKIYNYEVDLDIKNFFPSINPIAVFNYIIYKLPVDINEIDLFVLKKILIKLLFLKVNIETEKDQKIYYGQILVDSKKSFSKGLPQGLSQSYFFANIIMSEFSKIFNSIFNGKSLYYVDDSVIFTNNLDGNLENFNNKISDIESKINNFINEYNNDSINGDCFIEKYFNDLSIISNELNYNIEIHRPETKGSFINIENSSSGERYLKSISREASKISFDLNTNYSDIEEVNLQNKINTILNQVNNELDKVNVKIDDESTKQLEIYKKKLIKYKKFFEYRKMILDYRESKNFNQVYERINSVIDKGAEEYLAFFNEDILDIFLNYIIKFDDDINCSHMLKGMEKFNKELLKNISISNSYINHVYIKRFNNSMVIKNINKYSSIESLLLNKYKINSKVYEKVKDDLINDNIKFINKDFGLINHIFNDKNFENMIILVDNNTQQLKREILNAFFSYIFNFDINDTYNFYKKDNRPIKYKELRILVYIRNNKFVFNDFINKLEEFIYDYDNTKIDYSILEVLNRFKTFVVDPEKIDNLIIAHKFTCDAWRNGSKHLYFYTLHNQEHAIDLIKNIISIVKSISFFDISPIDYYILFLSCYLHDISMVTLPNLDDFLKNDKVTDCIASEFVDDLNKLDCINYKSTKFILKKYYKKLDEFYEGLVRNNHSKNSANEIKHRIDLNFIEESIRDIVADVSEAHGYDIYDIYNVKANTSKKLISKKYMKILLRLADLLDMSNYRVSKIILNNNLENMSEVSRFHWLSHLITESCDVLNEYEVSEDKEVCLSNKSIDEIINIRIRVNLSQLTKEKPRNCNFARIKKNSLKREEFYLECINGTCDGENCNFLCKWLMTKNNYLFKELKALEDYLNLNTNNYFNSKIYVKVEIIDKLKLEHNEFDMIKSYIE
ncbi:TPA: reverse transcriptase domain-containing protein [Clostridium perfringens]